MFEVVVVAAAAAAIVAHDANATQQFSEGILVIPEKNVWFFGRRRTELKYKIKYTYVFNAKLQGVVRLDDAYDDVMKNDVGRRSAA